MSEIYVVYNYHLNDNAIIAFTSRFGAVEYINNNRQLPLAHYPLKLVQENNE